MRRIGEVFLIITRDGVDVRDCGNAWNGFHRSGGCGSEVFVKVGDGDRFGIAADPYVAVGKVFAREGDSVFVDVVGARLTAGRTELVCGNISERFTVPFS